MDVKWIEEAKSLLKRHEEANEREKWDIPFPMAVFGTLRQGWGNHFLMGIAEGSPPEELDTYLQRRYGWYFTEDEITNKKYPRYKSHHKAFLPHFTATGLSVNCSPGASAVFEIYTYEPEQWKLMIPNVDSLESFTPGEYKGKYGYHRTLAWVFVLPDDYESEYFSNHHSRAYTVERNLRIPQEQWEQYPKVPCWVYSSNGQNEECGKLENSPVIWY